MAKVNSRVQVGLPGKPVDPKKVVAWLKKLRELQAASWPAERQRMIDAAQRSQDALDKPLLEPTK